jgi:prophage antirepressor-like protein
MQAVELANKLFNGTAVRIFGTPDEPLFIANDVATILDIKNVRTSIAKFENYKKGVVRTMDTLSGEQLTTVLTEAGLHSLVLKSKKPVAKEFEKWVLTEVVPAIRKTGNYNLQDNVNKQLEQQLEESQTEIARLKLDYQPIITYHDFDINEFTDEPCVYLISLNGTDFKFGVSGEIDCRSAAHFSKFRKLGLDPKIINLWKCESMKIMKDTEMKIKLFARHNHILVEKYHQKEIICTDNIGPIVANITRYVSHQNARELTVTRLREKELDIELKRLDNANLQLRLRMMEISTIPVNAPREDAIATSENVCTVTPIITDKKEISRSWVAANPPNDKEITTVYYARYSEACSNSGVIHNNQFGKLVVEQTGFVRRSNGTERYWAKR